MFTKAGDTEPKEGLRVVKQRRKARRCSALAVEKHYRRAVAKAALAYREVREKMALRWDQVASLVRNLGVEGEVKSSCQRRGRGMLQSSGSQPF